MNWILLMVHPLGEPKYEAIGFESEGEINAFIRNPLIGDRGWLKIQVQSPQEVIEYFESRL